MFKVFFVLFLVVPLVELYVLIQVGSEIGALPTILLTLFTAALGAGLMRHQGISTLQKAQVNMAQGQVPAVEMFEGVLIFVGGVLLLVPGLITDALGFLLLLPFFRQWLAIKLIRQRQTQYARQKGQVYEAEWAQQEDGQITRRIKVVRTNQEPGDVIDGEWQDPNAKK
ncbi:FxsA protein [Hydrogenovibrio sp. SC-1]|uniref:FxsA family protein n=1 Tax=Hydrogenovibrio sp. SC-1 TaxID=2065820 RepID=UPI000C7A32BF|nr:FxsA family protein [Hydrogenovibrio sp. SC-1]PLA75047.1 FxsA protein [Hydrogenovibrio sp. SC-1]